MRLPGPGAMLSADSCFGYTEAVKRSAGTTLRGLPFWNVDFQ